MKAARSLVPKNDVQYSTASDFGMTFHAKMPSATKSTDGASKRTRNNVRTPVYANPDSAVVAGIVFSPRCDEPRGERAGAGPAFRSRAQIGMIGWPGFRRMIATQKLFYLVVWSIVSDSL